MLWHVVSGDLLPIESNNKYSFLNLHEFQVIKFATARIQAENMRKLDNTRKRNFAFAISSDSCKTALFKTLRLFQLPQHVFITF